jgi:hypothetical protein
MKKLTTLISALFFLLIGVPQVWALPACPSSGYFDNCYGTYVFDNGDKYVGVWQNNKQHGQGTFYFLRDDQFKGDKHVGEYKNGKRNGQGTYYYLADNQWKGDKYVGEYKDDNKHGQGTYTWADGDKHVGGWQNDKQHGQGTYTYASGSINQIGIFKNGEFLNAFPKCVGSYSVTTWTNCFGTSTYTNGDYVGAWKNGKRNGQGTYTYAEGDKYVGEYKDGKQHGQGTYTWVSGSKYVGE